jgi:hypothetical protein
MFCTFETSRKIKGAGITPTDYLHVATTYKGPNAAMLVLLVTKLICKSLSWHIRTKLNEKP